MRIRVGLVALVALIVASLLAASASASCIQTTTAEQRARADVVFDGRALDSPTATGVQRFVVTRYLKGRGPAIVRVDTGTIRRADGTGTTTSVSLYVQRGERWRIFAQGVRAESPAHESLRRLAQALAPRARSERSNSRRRRSSA